MSVQLRIILTVSIILNVFLVGVGIGVLVTGAHIAPAQPPPQHRLAPNAWLAAETLPPDERVKFRQMLRDRATAVQPELKAVHLARREAIDAMSQPTYDPKLAADALRRAREGELKAREEIDAAIVDYLTHLSPDQRGAVAAAMVRSRPGQLNGADGGSPGRGRSGAGGSPIYNGTPQSP